ncbi:MAG TPA: GNAT family N-acetyltransferase [Thermomicrobiales bacterium]
MSALDPAQIGFRPLRHEDLPLMHRWLNHGPALKWYGLRPTTLDEIVAEYAPMITGEDPTRAFLVTYADRPIGYIQTYLIRDEPDYQAATGAPDDAAGVDLFIGEPDFLYRGLGPALLRRFLAEIVFADDRVGQVIIGPHPENASAIRAYAKVGFRYLRTVPVPGEAHPEYLMVLTRDEFARMYQPHGEGQG